MLDKDWEFVYSNVNKPRQPPSRLPPYGLETQGLSQIVKPASLYPSKFLSNLYVLGYIDPDCWFYNENQVIQINLAMLIY